MTREKQIMNRLYEHYNYLINKGYKVVCLMLQGSQNYNLDEYSNEYQSDIDSKAIVLPHFRDFVYEQKPISHVEILPNNEHIDVKDIRVMFEQFKKENISYIELLYTDFYIINEKYKNLIKPLFINREAIATINTNQFLRCIEGMAGNKLKALCHPYPNLIDKIKKYGYDGKQLSHCVRLFEFISRYTRGVPIKECYITEDRELLINLKKQLNAAGDRVLTCDEAVAACNFYFNEIKRIKERYLLPQDKINIETIKWLDDLKYKILEFKFKEDIKWKFYD